MSDNSIPRQATPPEELRRQIMSECEAKTEREWWSKRHIEKLEAIVNEVGRSGFTDIDERLDYVEVQVDRKDWEELQRLRTDKGEGE